MRTNYPISEGNILSKILLKRYPDRFPEDFMFILTKEEMTNLRCQIASSNWGGTRYPTMAFTEHGVALIYSMIKI
ncbi:ORF6N domain-containing protein [Ulvibacter antarcticus]|uniref:ORF6N domain-containing protein n=1 Tax=Ulvibacter antarcticus TaxID=442714 RepID=A0A3L9Z6P4_9FLAO|nr:ORF6N domain-containing protein [Ulvibacter antarcticus]RMA66078.1 ORF6N domain-containing protein [Ulvibacter antarcticus]